jgi:hypothetical protein
MKDTRPPTNATSIEPLRERLRREAAAVMAEQTRAELQEQDRERAYREKLLPKMLYAAEYFRAIIDDINIINPIVLADFPIGPSDRETVELKQGGYRIFVDDASQPREITVSCTCSLSEPIVKHCQNARDADTFEAVVREMGLGYHRRRQSDLSTTQTERSRFLMEGQLSASFTIKANVENTNLEVTTHNLEEKPRILHTLSLETVDEAFLESLTSLLLRESSILIQRQISEQTRQELRATIDAHEKSREAMLEETRVAEALESANRLDKRIVRSAGETSKMAAKAVYGKTRQALKAIERTSNRAESDK